MKTCGKCREAKSVELFGKNKRYSDGLWPYCKPCDAKRTAEYRAANPDRVKEIQARSRSKNPDRIAMTKAKYRAKNPEKVKEARKLAYEKNRGRELAKAKEWKKRNPHVNREIMATRTAKKKMATPVWFDKKAVRELHAEAVRLESITGIAFHVDHIVPIKSDLVCGLHWHGNMQLLPASANQSKSNRYWPDMP